MAKKRESRKPVALRPEPRPARRKLWILGGLLLTIAAALEVYAPALHAPFVFDDDYLPFKRPDYPTTLWPWLLGVRPVLMLTYWVNFKLSGLQTGPYHFVNVLIHAGSAVLVFFVLRALLRRAGLQEAPRRLFSLFGAGLFLVHPLQTESVAYVASRSEDLSGMFLLAALVLFLSRSDRGISGPAAAGVWALFACAVGTKEHTVVLPALLLLTDYFWDAGFSFRALRRNWRVYVPIAAGALAGAVFVFRILAQAQSAGFHVKGLTWYQYFFTECRAIFVYLGLYAFPFHQTADYDYPISRTLLDHGAILALAALVVLAGAAWYFRKRYPLACYGFLFFLLAMAPTSSFVPIADPVAERRVYVAFVGLLLVTIDVLRRLPVRRNRMAAALAAVLLGEAALAYQRNLAWSSPVALWEDTVRKSPRKSRAHFQLAYAYYQAGRCQDAIREYAAVASLRQPDYTLLVDWALADDCANQPEQALARFRQAAALERTAHVYAMIGTVYARQSRWPEALDALDTAEKLDPTFAVTYVNRGGVRAKMNEFALAARDYRSALKLDPSSTAAVQGLAFAEAQLRAGH